MKISDSIKNIIRSVVILGWLIFLFLISISFYNQINLLMVLFLLYTFIVIICFRSKITFNLEFVLLLAFGTAYFFTYVRYNDYSRWTHVKYFLGAPGMYFIGKAIITEKTMKYFKAAILVIVFGLFLYAFTAIIPALIANSFQDLSVVNDFWDGFLIGSTTISIYYTGIGALIVYNIFHLNSKKGLLVRILHIVALGLSIYFAIIMARRTFFIISAIVLILMLLAELVLSKKKAIKPLIVTVVLLAIIVIVIRYDIFDIKTFIVSSRWYVRYLRTLEIGLLNDPRFQVYGLVRGHLFTYPFGGYQMDIGNLPYAHNLWLDVLYAVGYYSFFPLVAFSLLSFTTLIRLLLHKHISNDIKILVASLFIAYNLHFMVEPIIEGYAYPFFQFILINGMTYQYLLIANRIIPSRDFSQMLKIA